ncbi:hypothetical protein [Desulfolucanica intricata]|uniref:hypothetical protein n=1 Tax=Desulfolucanica intricata TaxID=1285191 RepID=UPI0008356E20|nr:hypothetical protein [Desulfolucanica intricata]
MKFKKSLLMGMGVLLTFAAGVCVENNLNLSQELINNGHALLGSVSALKAKLLNEVNQLISTAKITIAILLGILGNKMSLIGLTARGPTFL